MQKLYSELLRMGVYEESSKQRLASVRDIIIDPENANVLAFLLDNMHIVVPIDVEYMSTSIIVLDKDRIVPLHEVLRVKQVYQMGISVLGARVITEVGHKYIGHVFDYEIDTTHMLLKKIYVAKIFLLFHVDERIIPSEYIVKISKNTITVREKTAITVEEKTNKATSQALAV